MLPRERALRQTAGTTRVARRCRRRGEARLRRKRATHSPLPLRLLREVGVAVSAAAGVAEGAAVVALVSVAVDVTDGVAVVAFEVSMKGDEVQQDEDCG
jgi:hypothetical protein